MAGTSQSIGIPRLTAVAVRQFAASVAADRRLTQVAKSAISFNRYKDFPVPGASQRLAEYQTVKKQELRAKLASGVKNLSPKISVVAAAEVVEKAIASAHPAQQRLDSLYSRTALVSPGIFGLGVALALSAARIVQKAGYAVSVLVADANMDGISAREISKTIAELSKSIGAYTFIGSLVVGAAALAVPLLLDRRNLINGVKQAVRELLHQQD